MLTGAPLTVDASESSQFLSALLLAAAALDGGLSVRPAGKVASAPYVRTTVAVLEKFGHGVSRGPQGAVTVARGSAGPRSYAVPGDWSSAIPFLAAAGIAGGEVRVTGLEWPSPTRTPKRSTSSRRWVLPLTVALTRSARGAIAEPAPP